MIKSVNFKIEAELKEEAEQVLESMGLTMTSALKMFLKQVVNRREIPFTIEAQDPFFSERNQAILLESISELDKGNGKVRDLIEVD